MRRFLFAALMLGIASPAFAGSSESIGTDVAIALPAIAGGITLTKNDWMGAAQLTVDTVATVGLAYGLKHVIKEQRPDKSDFQSMPSDTAALAFAPAQFLGTAMAGNMAFRLTGRRPSSPGAGWMRRNTIGTTWPPAPASPSA